MLTAEQIAALRDLSGQLMDPVTEFLIRDIAQRVSEAGQLTGTAAYQTWQLQKLGVSQKKLKEELQKQLKVSQKRVEQLLTQAAAAGYDFDISRFPTVDAIPFEENTNIQQILDAAVKLAQDDLTNITQTIGFVTPTGKAVGLTDAYKQTCDFAFMKVATGAQDYISVVREATKALAEKGIQVIDYESGVHTSLEAAVRRNIMGGLGLMQEQISQQNHDDLGCDGWEISAHGGSAPDHEPLQGRQYPDKQYRNINNSLHRRIGTLNCGHSAMPIIMGVNSPQYTDEELEEFRRQNEEGVTVGDKHYTLYEATQRQRSLERSIRKRKAHILVDEELGDTEKLQQDQIRLQILKQRYHEFSKAAGLPEQYERLEKAGFTWKHGKAAERVAKKAIAKPEEPSYNVEKLGYSGKTTPELERRFEESISRMPIKHRELAETKITGIEISDSDIGSWYSRKTGKICLSEKACPDSAIHEYSHALADAVGAYADPKFKAIMRKGLENISPADIIYDEETFKRPIYRIECDKFISKYQGRLYEEVGIYDGKNISLDGMLDYFSEGYEEYIRNPDNLKEHDPDLFVYFEGII